MELSLNTFEYLVILKTIGLNAPMKLDLMVPAPNVTESQIVGALASARLSLLARGFAIADASNKATELALHPQVEGIMALVAFPEARFVVVSRDADGSNLDTTTVSWTRELSCSSKLTENGTYVFTVEASPHPAEIARRLAAISGLPDSDSLANNAPQIWKITPNVLNLLSSAMTKQEKFGDDHTLMQSLQHCGMSEDMRRATVQAFSTPDSLVGYLMSNNATQKDAYGIFCSARNDLIWIVEQGAQGQVPTLSVMTKSRLVELMTTEIARLIENSLPVKDILAQAQRNEGISA